MRVGSFATMITPGRERDSSGYVEMRHGDTYSIRLCNYGNAPCDAEVSIDGKSIGLFRVNSRQDITLKGKPGDSGCFTFYQEATREAAASGVLDVTKDNRGLIEVLFRPGRSREREKAVLTSGLGLSEPDCGFFTGEREQKTSGGISFGFASKGITRGGPSPQAGITGLSGHQNQQWQDIPNLLYDQNAEVKISLRLVSFGDYGPRPLTPALQANPGPAPVS